MSPACSNNFNALTLKTTQRKLRYIDNTTKNLQVCLNYLHSTRINWDICFMKRSKLISDAIFITSTIVTKKCLFQMRQKVLIHTKPQDSTLDAKCKHDSSSIHQTQPPLHLVQNSSTSCRFILFSVLYTNG